MFMKTNNSIRPWASVEFAYDNTGKAGHTNEKLGFCKDKSVGMVDILCFAGAISRVNSLDTAFQ